MPASETVDFEPEFAELVRELRSVPSEAPAELREHVRGLGEPEPRRTVRVPRVSRRMVLVVVPACVLAIVAAAVVRGLVDSSTGGHHETLVAHTAHGKPNAKQRAGGRGEPGKNVFSATTRTSLG